MKWTEIAVEKLQKYRALRASLTNIPEQIEVLELKFTGINNSQTDRIPNRSGGNRWEDFVIDNISEREELKLLFMMNKKIVNTIKRGLAALSEDEQLVLEYFYIQHQPKYADKVAEKITEELNIERAEVYRLKERALQKFVLNMYGLPEYFS